MKKTCLLSLGILAAVTLVSTRAGAQDLSKSVVTVYATTIEYDYYSPWQVKRHTSISLQGTVIDVAKGYILTLSHPLLNAVQVEVSKLGGERRHKASILLSDYTTGLAIIHADEKDFYKDINQARLHDRKIKLASASIAKWDNQKIFKTYSCEPLSTQIQSYEDFGVALFHEMTTALDSGGEGEPVFQGGRLVGIVAWFDSKRKTVKVNSFETIAWLQADLSRGKQKGQPFFYVRAAYLRGDENLKEYLGLGKQDTGIAVESIPAESSGSGVLRPRDVILAIDGQKIDDTGYCSTQEYGKLNFLWLIGLKHHTGDTVSMSLVRDKKRITITFPLVSSSVGSFLIPPQFYDSTPRYFITGGLLFQELSKPYMEIWGNEWHRKGDKRFLRLISEEWASPSKTRKRAVILNRVLPANANAGYHDKANLLLTSVNGARVSDLIHLKELIALLKDEFAVFEFVGNESIVIRRTELASSMKDILSRYGISSSDNLSD